jgi:hypothetical protein
MGQTYECWAQSHGALLSLPHGAQSEDVIRTKLFEDYIRDNVDNWLRWSKKEGLPVENMEDLILVTGCTLAKSWAVAAFDGTMSRGEGDATTISLEARKSDGGGAQFVWRNMRGSVVHNHSDSVCSPAYFFVAVNLNFSIILEYWRTRESVPLHQGLQSKTPFLLDQTPPGCSRALI